LRIAFDPQIFSLQPFGGISRYFAETARHLAAMADTEVAVLAFAHLNSHLDAVPRPVVVGRRVPVLRQSLRSGLAAANRLMARAWLARHPVDIVHETYYSARATAPRGRACSVLTVLDMIHEKFPDFSAGSRHVVRTKRAAIERADHIICISENTRRDLLDLTGVAKERTSVVRLGFSMQAGPVVEKEPDETPPQPYILYVGKRGDYKNFATLLEAYAGSAALMRDYLLVCFGDAPFSGAELEAARRLGVPEGRLRHFGGGDARLAAFYRGARVFVYPSRYEGFGIPPLEAMSFDCPVICGNTSSLPEVVGDAARTVDPGDAAALRAELEAVLGQPALAGELRRRGRERIRLFSWEECARQTRAVYASLL